MDIKSMYLRGRSKKQDILDFIEEIKHSRLLTKEKANSARHFIERAFQVAFIQESNEKKIKEEDLRVIISILNQVARGKRKAMFEITEDNCGIRECFSGEEWDLVDS